MEFTNPGQAKIDPRWVGLVSQDAELTGPEQAAVTAYLAKKNDKRNLRAFWHEPYGQWWIHEKGWPERQIGCVFADIVSAP